MSQDLNSFQSTGYAFCSTTAHRKISILAGEIFGPLRDATLFKQVIIDPEVHTLVWPNGADFDPATLHDWPEHSTELEARAQSWTPSPT